RALRRARARPRQRPPGEYARCTARPIPRPPFCKQMLVARVGGAQPGGFAGALPRTGDPPCRLGVSCDSSDRTAIDVKKEIPMKLSRELAHRSQDGLEVTLLW